MTGEACRELEVVTEEALSAEAGTEVAEERDGRKDVCTWLGFARLIEDDCGFWEAMVVVDIVGADVGSQGVEILSVVDIS